MRGILIDTNAIYAIADPDDKAHNRIKRFLEDNSEPLIAPITVIPEACYFINKRLGSRAENKFVASCIRGDPRVEPLAREDLTRSLELMEYYTNANIGFVDASLAAIAERLLIRQILTFDRRHFSMFRPKHCPSLTLLP